MRKIALAVVLLAIPIVALMWVPSYARETPKLFGFPFFFWYQFLWVLLCSAFTWTAYRLTLSARAPRRRAPDAPDAPDGPAGASGPPGHAPESDGGSSLGTDR